MTRPARGRRPGSPDTREAILASARNAFAASGFAGATIRGIAGEAGVDPALVHHYFGSKDELFMASLSLPVDPRVLLETVVAAGSDGAGERLLRTLLSVWDDPDMQLPLIALARTIAEPGGQRLLGEGFIPVVIAPALARLSADRPEVRVPLVASQVVGLILARYVLAVPGLAEMPADDVVALIGPTIQRYLTDDLPA